jgi:hypothetical protein
MTVLPLVSLISKLFELLCRSESKLEVYLIMRHYVIPMISLWQKELYFPA